MNERDEDGISEFDIAVIGIGLRLPGAADVDAFWNNLRQGVESIRWFRDDEVRTANPDYANQPNYVRAGAVLPDVEFFDAEFFGYTPREAEAIDPQHRLFLECAWEAFEDAGYAPQSFPGSVGVYAGCALNTYLINNVHPNRGFFPDRTFLESAYDFQLLMASESDHIATRVSYKFNLRGPSINLQTACSTSLVAVHLACQGILMGECDMALAGSSTIRVPQTSGSLAEDGMVFSSDGHTRTFDRKGNGTILGSGVGAVLLKPLAAAIKDRDAIYAVIKGTAVNNDGASKVGFTAPSVDGQAAAIKRALANAGVAPETISYVEAHGTATALGDPIEVAALTQAFATQKKTFCALGSVKTNIGHVGRTAGMAGLIKTALALKKRQLPASLHFEAPNPQIDFANSPFYVNSRLQDWAAGETPRRAGVSAFGVGGTNAHVVLEETPPMLTHASSVERSWHVLALSAKSDAALKQLTERYVHFLDSSPNPPALADICHTANVGRQHFQSRFSIAASSISALKNELLAFGGSSDDVEAQALPSGGTNPESRTVAFLFSGQGVHYENMAWQLYETQPTFRLILDKCDATLSSYWDLSLLDILNPRGSRNELVHDIAYTQGVMFSIEYALAHLWMSWGINPAVVMGHSTGEYAAAAVAGVFSLEDGLWFSAERGRLFKSLVAPDGKMVAVGASEEQVKHWLEPHRDRISIAAINGPRNTVISGYSDAVSALCAELHGQGVVTTVLPIARAGHSPLTESMLTELYEVAKRIRFSAPRIPVVSNVTGTLGGAELATPEYWCRHTRDAVRFAKGMQTLSLEGANVFVEIGPDPVLLGMGAFCLPHDDLIWLPSLRRPLAAATNTHDEWQCLASSVAAAYKSGCYVDWRAFDADYSRRRVHLPTYPFQRRRFWIDANSETTDRAARVPQTPAAFADRPVDSKTTSGALWQDWLLEVKWKKKERSTNEADTSGRQRNHGPCHWFVLSDRNGAGDALVKRLIARGQTCTQMHQADFARGAHSNMNHHDRVTELLDSNEQRPYGVIYLWSLDAQSVEDASFNGDAASAVWDSSEGLVAFVQAAAKRANMPQRLCVVTCAAQAVSEGDRLDGLIQAPLWPLTQVVAMEYPEVSCIRVDFGNPLELNDTEKLVQEILQASSEDAVAFRGDDRYVARLARAGGAASSKVARFGSQEHPTGPHPEGFVVITGGLGGLGLTLAGWLSKCGVCRLALVGRSTPDAEASETIARLRRDGITVTVVQADVSDLAQMRAAFEQVDALGYPIVGIIHAAAVLDDGVISEQCRERFLKVLLSKVQGAWNLHSLVAARAQQPDYLVLFSSATSLLGNAGQANYAAANGFLDCIAHYRRVRGQACVAINWGAWAEAGTLVRNDALWKRLQQRGFRAIPSEAGLASLQGILAQGYRQVGVVPMDWPIYLSEHDLAHTPFYEHIVQPERLPAKLAGSLRERLAGTPMDGWYDVIRDSVRGHVMHVLGLKFKDSATRSIDDDRPLADYGLDSLFAIELKNRIQKSIGHVLPITLAFDYPSVTAMAGYVSGLLVDRAGNTPAIETRSDIKTEVQSPLPRLAQSAIGEAAVTDGPRFAGRGKRGLVGEEIAIAGESNFRVWQGDITLKSHPWIRAHSVQQMPILPGAGYIEMILNAAKTIAGDGPCRLSEVAFSRALPILETSQITLQMVLQQGDENVVRIFSKQGNAKAWTQHASAKVARIGTHPGAFPHSRDAIVARCKARLDPKAFYAAVNGENIEYVGLFQRIAEIWITDEEVLAKVTACRVFGGEPDPHVIHPAFIDACLQVSLVNLLERNSSGEPVMNGSVVSGGIRQVTVIRPPQEDVWVYVTKSSCLVQTGSMPDSESEWDIKVLDERFQLLMSMEGLSVRRLPPVSGSDNERERHVAHAGPVRAAAPSNEKGLALSFQQLKYLTKRPDAQLVIAKIIHLSGRLDVAGCARSIEDVVQRHESLRTRFELVDGEPLRIIEPPGTFRVSIKDVSGSPDADTQARNAAHEVVSAPFMLVGQPTFRACLLKISDNDYTLVLALHHIVGDMVALEALSAEVSAVYGAYVTSCRPLLPRLSFDYRDYISAQAEWLRSPTAEQHRLYWCERLSGISEPTANSRGRFELQNGATIESAELHAELVGALVDVAKQKHTTLFAILFTAYHMLLGRWRDNYDTLVVTPVANRTMPGTENVIGSFAVALPVRPKLSGDMSFDQALKSTSEAFLQAFSRQDSDFIVPELAKLKHRYLFGFENHARHHVTFTGMKSTEYDVFPDWSFDSSSLTPVALLTFITSSSTYIASSRTFLHPPAHGLSVLLAGNVKPESLRRFRDEFLLLLQAITTDPGRIAVDGRST